MKMKRWGFVCRYSLKKVIGSHFFWHTHSFAMLKFNLLICFARWVMLTKNSSDVAMKDEKRQESSKERVPLRTGGTYPMRNTQCAVVSTRW